MNVKIAYPPRPARRARVVALHSSGGTSLRFAHFFIQAACMIAMGVVIAATSVP